MSNSRRLSSQSTTEDTAHLRKTKRTKTNTACDACRKRRSRCELLEETGCHRCRVLGTTCSLTLRGDMVEDGRLSSLSPSTSTNLYNNDEEQSMLVKIENRIAKIEQMLAQLVQRGNTSSRSTNTQRRNVEYAEERNSTNWTGAVWQILGGIGQSNEHRLLDPVELGVLN